MDFQREVPRESGRQVGEVERDRIRALPGPRALSRSARVFLGGALTAGGQGQTGLFLEVP